MSKAIQYKRTGILYAADSEKRLPSIVVTISRVDGMYRYLVTGPANLTHASAGRFDIAGDRSECEATVKALKSLTPARTWQLREEIRAEWAEGITKGEFSEDDLPPLLGITIRTSSPTFAQLGEYLSDHPRVETKGGRLEPSMRTLHNQLRRFDVWWELIENRSAATGDSNSSDATKEPDEY